jgi:hypothetical protein
VEGELVLNTIFAYLLWVLRTRLQSQELIVEKMVILLHKK